MGKINRFSPLVFWHAQIKSAEYKELHHITEKIFSPFIMACFRLFGLFAHFFLFGISYMVILIAENLFIIFSRLQAFFSTEAGYISAIYNRLYFLHNFPLTLCRYLICNRMNKLYFSGQKYDRRDNCPEQLPVRNILRKGGAARTAA